MSLSTLRSSLLPFCLLATIAIKVSATIAVPATITEVVQGADHIGLVEVSKAEVYRINDVEGELQCGIIIQGSWLDSLTGETGQVEFLSRNPLEVDAVYLVFLADKSLPRKLMSTNSLSESLRERRLVREQNCTRSLNLAKTIFRSSKFLNEQYVADSLRTGIWVENPDFSDNEFDIITIYPSELTINDVKISRDQFLDAYYGEPAKYQVVRTAGYSLFIFRAVDWKQYCGRLVELAAKRFDIPPNRGFCERRTWVETSRW